MVDRTTAKAASVAEVRPELLLVAALAMVASAACWGTATVASKALLETVPPVTLLAAQLTASALFLLACCGLRRSPSRGWSPALLAPLFVLGVLEPGISDLLATVGLSMTTAAKASVLELTEPVLVCVLAWWFLGERTSPRVVAGIAVTVAGLVLIGAVDLGAARAPGDSRGDTLVLLGAAVSAAAIVLAARLLVHLDALRLALGQQLAGLALVVAWVATSRAETGFLLDLDPSLWLAAGLTGVAKYALASWFFLIGLKLVGSVVSGVSTLMIPVFGVGGAVVMLGERLSSSQAVGCLVVVLGVAIVVRGQRRAAVVPR